MNQTILEELFTMMYQQGLLFPVRQQWKRMEDLLPMRLISFPSTFSFLPSEVLEIRLSFIRLLSFLADNNLLVNVEQFLRSLDTKNWVKIDCLPEWH